MSSPIKISPADMVPRSGKSAWLTSLAGAVMGFLAVLVLIFALVGSRLADVWSSALEDKATLVLPNQAVDPQVIVEALQKVAGVASVRLIPESEQIDLIRPWLGQDIDGENLPLPLMFELTEDAPPFAPAAILTAVDPLARGARLDQHERWREPMETAARRLRLVGVIGALAVMGGLVLVITFAVQASLAANAPILRTLRLVGASDGFVARAFVRRFTLRAFAGSAFGAIAGFLACLGLLKSGVFGSLDGALGPLEWRQVALLGLVPIVAGLGAFLTARRTVFSTLRRGI